MQKPNLTKICRSVNTATVKHLADGTKVVYDDTVGGGSGLNRRELFTDARDISSNVGSDDALTDAEYIAQLQQRGKEKLAENVSITSFEGETETTIMFQYGKDFFNGDIVQIANEYGHETKARILEIVRSEDKDGYSVYPTFKTIEQEGA